MGVCRRTRPPGPRLDSSRVKDAAPCRAPRRSCRSVFPMQVMNWWSPAQGRCAEWPPATMQASSVTSFTLSARMPIVVGSPSIGTLDHHDAGVAAGIELRHAEDQAQIRQRYDAGRARLIRPSTVLVGAGHRGDRHRIEDFAYLAGLDGRSFSPCSSSTSTTPSAAPVGCVRHPRVIPRPCCVFVELLAVLDPGARPSRINATGAGHPGMVAPEKAPTSACSLDSDLMTVWWSPIT